MNGDWLYDLQDASFDAGLQHVSRNTPSAMRGMYTMELGHGKDPKAFIEMAS